MNSRMNEIKSAYIGERSSKFIIGFYGTRLYYVFRYIYAILVRDKLPPLHTVCKRARVLESGSARGYIHAFKRASTPAATALRRSERVKHSIIALNCKSCSKSRGIDRDFTRGHERRESKTGWSMVHPPPRRKGNDQLDDRLVLSRKRWSMMDASFVCRNHVHHVMGTCRGWIESSLRYRPFTIAIPSSVMGALISRRNCGNK